MKRILNVSKWIIILRSFLDARASPRSILFTDWVSQSLIFFGLQITSESTSENVPKVKCQTFNDKCQISYEISLDFVKSQQTLWDPRRSCKISEYGICIIIRVCRLAHRLYTDVHHFLLFLGIWAQWIRKWMWHFVLKWGAKLANPNWTCLIILNQ